jgi:hypothetical protein
MHTRVSAQKSGFFIDKHYWKVAQDSDNLPAIAGCCPITPVMIERLPVLQPLLAYLLFCLPLIIDWRDQRHGTLDLHQHNVLDGTGGPTLAVEGHRLLKKGSFLRSSKARQDRAAYVATMLFSRRTTVGECDADRHCKLFRAKSGMMAREIACEPEFT